MTLKPTMPVRRLVRRLIGIGWHYRLPILGGWLCLAISAVLMGALAKLLIPLINIANGSPDAGDRTLLRLQNTLEPLGLWQSFWHVVNGPLESLSQFLGLGVPQLMTLLLCVLLGLAIALVRALFERWSYLLTHYVSFRSFTDIRTQVNDVLVRQRLGYFDRWRPGELMSRLQNDMETMNKALIFVCEEAPKVILTVLIGLTVAIHQAPHLMAVLVIIPVFWIPLKRLGKAIKRSSRHTLKMKGELSNDMHQQFGGMREIMGFRQEATRQKIFTATNESVFTGYMGIIRARALSRALIEGGGYMIVFLTIGAAVFVILRFGVTFGQFASIGLIVTSMVMEPLRTGSRAYNNFQESLPGARSILDVLDYPEPLAENPHPMPVPADPEIIRFENVGYRYRQDADPVLEGVSLDIRRGEVVALVGPTGSGKSTLVDFLPRFRDPVAGRVLFDDVDLSKASLADVRDRIALVTQDPYIFNISVRDNLKVGCPTAPDDALWKILDAVRLSTVVREKGGLDSLAGERGTRFSGGQRQRLAIARALLKNAPILILDEATSSQDSVTESELQEALELLMKGRTTFIIAHRLTTVRHADRVCVLKEGHLVEEGTHESLKDAGGEYARLYATQFAQT